MRRSAVLWSVAWLLTLGSAVWQRVSGPTYPTRVRAAIGGSPVQAKLLRSNSINSSLAVAVTAPDTSIAGAVIWRRHPTDDPWTTTVLRRDGQRLVARLPAQPMAGKLAYRVELSRPDGSAAGFQRLELPAGRPVVARFKGDVSRALLLLHVVVIFLAMLCSARAGLEALARGPRLQRHVAAATALMFAGGLILGPLVQKVAFDAYWTGWPIGRDLTDNKVAVAMLLWLVAWLRGRGGRDARGWTLSAALVTLVIFVVPHSLLGSQFDYRHAAVGIAVAARRPRFNRRSRRVPGSAPRASFAAARSRRAWPARRAVPR